MSDALERVLSLVAEGRLTVEEAGPILDALDTRLGDAHSAATGSMPNDAEGTTDDGTPARAVRIEVSEAGRKVVNLRVPIALGRAAVARVPGLSESASERIREAISAGIKGPILHVDDGDGDGVRIVIE
jgi:hypothetical protein